MFRNGGKQPQHTLLNNREKEELLPSSRSFESFWLTKISDAQPTYSKAAAAVVFLLIQQQLIQLRPLFSYCTAKVPSRLHTLDTSPLRELNQTQDRSERYAERKEQEHNPDSQVT
jgi:hypothetical protein